jgi:hypothetical protein
MRGTIGHEVLAGAIGGTSILGGAITSPLLAPVVDLASAAVTAGIAAHAVHSSSQGSRGTTRHALRDAVRRSLEQGDAPLAAHVLDVACRVRAGDARALRSLAMLVGRAFDARLREVMKSVEWVHSLTEVHAATVEACAEKRVEPCVEEEAPPASGRFPIAVSAQGLETVEAA